MKPKVSLLVAMRNEELHIEACVNSILAQDYPPDRLEILVLDGCSSDGSWKLVETLLQGRDNASLVKNTRMTQAAGWNVGIGLAAGDIIGIVSAHSELDRSYVSSAVATLQRTGADMVGGPMRALGSGFVGDAVAVATSTRFGVGGARFHYAETERDVDTVYMGLCWRGVYDRLGGFDEEMVRDQDDELSYRLLSAGGRIVCDPAIRSTYHNRATLRSLWRQYLQYGFWKVRVMQKHPRQMRVRQFAPSALVGAICISLLVIPFSRLGILTFLIIVGSYVSCSLGASLIASRQGAWRLFRLLPIIYATLHFAYGTGFVLGLIRFWNKWNIGTTRHEGLT